MKEEIDYEIKIPFKYAEKGDLTEAKFIKLCAPTSRNMTEIAFLKQAFYRALPKDSGKDQNSSTDKEEITGDDIMSIMTASMDVELSSVLVTARELFTTKGIAAVDGETKVTKPVIDDMHPDDFYSMVGEYLANFILASVLQKMKGS